MMALSWPLAAVSAANLIDPTWTVALKRADDAGKLLAEVLMSRAAGTRPVSLIGFSMGARVIFSALHELSKMEQNEDGTTSAGIVDTVVLLGTPISGENEKVLPRILYSLYFLNIRYRIALIACGSLPNVLTCGPPILWDLPFLWTNPFVMFRASAFLF
jgi:pimeloyl-ACP methyl ester carboxylesterase